MGKLNDYIRKEMYKRKRYYNATENEMAKKNMKTLLSTSLVVITLILLCFILTPLIIETWKITIYHILFIPVLAVFYIICRIYDKKPDKKYAQVCVLCLIFEAIVLTFTMMIDIFSSPIAPASFIPLVFVVIPTLFIMPLKYLYIFILGYEAIFIYWAYSVKNIFVAQYDVFTSIVGLIFSIAIVQIITNLRVKDYMLRMEYKALNAKDSVSAMMDRDIFEMEMEDYLKLKNPSATCSLIIIDINSIDKIRKEYGHNISEKFIVEFGQILQETFRGADIFGNFGNDQFGVFLKGAASIPLLDMKCDMIGKKLIGYAQRELSTDISYEIGCIGADEESVDVVKMFGQSYKALEAAKSSEKKKHYIEKYK